MMAANLAGHGSASGEPVCSKHCKKNAVESSPDVTRPLTVPPARSRLLRSFPLSAEPAGLVPLPP